MITDPAQQASRGILTRSLNNTVSGMLTPKPGAPKLTASQYAAREGANILGGTIGGGIGGVLDNKYGGLIGSMAGTAVTPVLSKLFAPSSFKGGFDTAAGAGISQALAGGANAGVQMLIHNLLAGRSGINSPYKAMAPALGGYAVGNLAQAGMQSLGNLLGLSNLVGGGANFLTNLGQGLISGLPSLGTGLLGSLVGYLGQGKEWGDIGSRALNMASPVISSALMPATMATSWLGTAVPVVGMVLNVLTQVWQEHKQKKAETHFRRRARTQYLNYLNEADPYAGQAMDAVLKGGEGRLQYFKSMGLPDDIVQGMGFDPETGLTKNENFLFKGPMFAGEDWHIQDPEQAALSRMIIGSNYIRDPGNMSQVSDPFGQLSKYEQYIADMLMGNIEGASLDPTLSGILRQQWAPINEKQNRSITSFVGGPWGPLNDLQKERTELMNKWTPGELLRPEIFGEIGGKIKAGQEERAGMQELYKKLVGGTPKFFDPYGRVAAQNIGDLEKTTGYFTKTQGGLDPGIYEDIRTILEGENQAKEAEFAELRAREAAEQKAYDDYIRSIGSP